MKLLTPYGMSDYIPGGIICPNRGEWQLVTVIEGDPKCLSCEEYDIVSTTNEITGKVDWWYRDSLQDHQTDRSKEIVTLNQINP